MAIEPKAIEPRARTVDDRGLPVGPAGCGGTAFGPRLFPSDALLLLSARRGENCI
jgi:hypothetical protein